MEVVRRILNLAASEWLDESGMTWLEHAPKIRLLPRNDVRGPYPISWDEQIKLFNQLPLHLRDMCLFAVNTGCRNQEICGLKWDDEVEIPEMGVSVFIIPGERVKNKEDRQDLLGHKSGRMTTHYSMAELSNLITATNTVCGDNSRKSPALVLLKKKIPLRVVGNATG
jgi:integrase